MPKNLAHVYVSPRKRAQRTLELLGLGCKGDMPWERHGEVEKGEAAASTEAKVEVTEAIREWEYGDYEGVTSKEIQARRKESGEGEWDIWRDGCPGGEYVFLHFLLSFCFLFLILILISINRSPQQITDRLDELIADIRSRFHAHAIGKPKGSVEQPFDVLVVAHGHILRAFAGRWVGKNIADNPSLILEAGGVGTLSYEHHSLNEPAILLGGAFMSDVVENAEAPK